MVRGFRWLVILLFLGAGDVRAADGPAATTVWEKGPSFLPPEAFARFSPSADGDLSAGAPAILSELPPSSAAGRALHWRNVPKPAWLLLVGSLGLLGVLALIRWRGARHARFNPVVIGGRAVRR